MIFSTRDPVLIGIPVLRVLLIIIEVVINSSSQPAIGDGDFPIAANATSGLGIDVEEVENGTYQLLEHSVKAEDAIQKTNSPNLDIIPAHIDLVAIEIELVDQENRESMLKRAITPLKELYDYILIDCAPSLGLLTLNALTASDSVIIPIQCEYFALEGLGKLLNTIKSVQKLHNNKLDIEGLLLTMYDSRLRLSNHFGRLMICIKTTAL